MCCVFFVAVRRLTCHLWFGKTINTTRMKWARQFQPVKTGWMLSYSMRTH